MEENMNTRSIIIGVVVVVALIALFMAFGGGADMVNPKPSPTPSTALVDYENLVTASGTLVPVKRASLSFKVPGQVEKIPVKIGDSVKANVALIRLADAEAQAAVKIAQATLNQIKAGATKEDVAIAQANLDTAKAQLAKVRAGATQEDAAMAKASLDRAAALLKNAQAEYDKIKDDPAIGMYPQSAALQTAIEQYRIADAQYKKVVKGATLEDIRVAESAVNAAQANLDRVKASARPEEITMAQARMTQAQSALSAMTLNAPFAGTVVAINVREGEMVAPSVPVITFGDLSQLRLETDDLSESNIARVKLGQAVNVTFEAMPGKTFVGKVTYIAPIASAKAGGTNYATYVEFEKLDPGLRWGMTGRVEINTKQ
jgi:HlyD family secretion protein